MVKFTVKYICPTYTLPPPPPPQCQFDILHGNLNMDKTPYTRPIYSLEALQTANFATLPMPKMLHAKNVFSIKSVHLGWQNCLWKIFSVHDKCMSVRCWDFKL